VPRYQHAVTFGGLTFDDPHFGKPYDHDRRLVVSEAMRQAIVEAIQQALPTQSTSQHTPS